MSGFKNAGLRQSAEGCSRLDLHEIAVHSPGEAVRDPDLMSWHGGPETTTIKKRKEVALNFGCLCLREICRSILGKSLGQHLVREAS